MFPLLWLKSESEVSIGKAQAFVKLIDLIASVNFSYQPALPVNALDTSGQRATTQMVSRTVLSSAVPANRHSTQIRLWRKSAANWQTMTPRWQQTTARNTCQPALKYNAILKDNDFRKIMEAERQNQLIARIEDFDQRQHALRGYL
ncbi:MAG: hypothetical protein AB7E59_03455 [Pusillimonas sp.]